MIASLWSPMLLVIQSYRGSPTKKPFTLIVVPSAISVPEPCSGLIPVGPSKVPALKSMANFRALERQWARDSNSRIYRPHIIHMYWLLLIPKISRRRRPLICLFTRISQPTSHVWNPIFVTTTRTGTVFTISRCKVLIITNFGISSTPYIFTFFWAFSRFNSGANNDETGPSTGTSVNVPISCRHRA